MSDGSAGARSSRQARCPRRGSLTTLLAILAAVACSGGGEEVPSVLADGSSVRPAPIELDGVDTPTVLTFVRSIDMSAAEPASRIEACLLERSETFTSERAVLRVGVDGESVTFQDTGRQGMYACDGSTGMRDEDLPWCGRAFGRLRGGRLQDPRLDLGCTTRAGSPVGFVWVEPSAGAAYVAVQRPGYTEVYPVLAGVPVRVATTTDVDLERSSIAVELSEHASDGRRLRAYGLEARAAG